MSKVSEANAPSVPGSLMTVEEVAVMLRVGRNAAYDAVRRGDVPSVRIGKLIRIPRAAVMRMLEGVSGRCP